MVKALILNFQGGIDQVKSGGVHVCFGCQVCTWYCLRNIYLCFFVILKSRFSIWQFQKFLPSLVIFNGGKVQKKRWHFDSKSKELSDFEVWSLTTKFMLLLPFLEAALGSLFFLWQFGLSSFQGGIFIKIYF